MAIAPRLISLNLGSQTLGLAEFRVQPHGGLVLLDYKAVATLLFDFRRRLGSLFKTALPFVFFEGHGLTATF